MNAVEQRLVSIDSAREQRMAAAYQRRRKWTRTDTTRWLDARSEALLAWMRRHGPAAPRYSSKMGQWLKDNSPDHGALYDRAHASLTALPDDPARERATILQILR